MTTPWVRKVEMEMGIPTRASVFMVTETDFRPCDVEMRPLPPASVPFLPPLQKGSGEEKQAEARRHVSWVQGKDFAESKSLYGQETEVRALRGD